MIPYKVYERILQDEISFPSDFLDTEAQEIIRKLLNKCSEGRIITSICEFKAHAWFKDIKWIDILKQRVTPPFIPNMKEELSKDYLLSNQGLEDVIDEEMGKHFGAKRRFRAGITMEIEKLWEDDYGSKMEFISQNKSSGSTVDIAG